MASKTSDTAPPIKGKRSPTPISSKTKSLVQKQANPLASNSNIPTYPKPKFSSAPDNNQAKKPSSHDHNKQNTPTRRRSLDKPLPPSGLDNTLGKNTPLSNSLNTIPNKPNLDRRRSLGFSKPPSLCNSQGKKLIASSSDPNIHNRQATSRRILLDKPPPLSSPDNKKLVAKNDSTKQTLNRRRSFDKPPLSSPLLKNRTSPNPKERVVKPSLSFSGKSYTSLKPLTDKLSKIPHPSKDAIGKKHSPGLYARSVKQDSHAGVATKASITSNLKDVVENVTPQAEDLEQMEDHQEPMNEIYNVADAAHVGESYNLVIEDDDEELDDNINIDEYLKAAESSFVAENYQQYTKAEELEEQVLVEETNINNQEDVIEEIINYEPSKVDVEEIEKRESVMDENQEEKEESEIKLLDEQEKEEKTWVVNVQEESEEGGKERKVVEESNNSRTSCSMPMASFAKAYPHLVQGKLGNRKESVVSNDVIEETASKLREQRKNRVKALAGAFEAVISLQDPRG